MKKIIFTMALLFFIAGVTGVSSADLSIGETIKKIPSLKQGIGYSFIENEVEYLTTLEALKKGGLTLELGYSSEDALVGVLSYQLVALDKYIDVPVIKELEANIGLYYGVKRIKADNEQDYGLSLTLLNVKF